MNAWVNYARPHVDDKPAQLVVEIARESSRLHFRDDGPRLEFFNDTRTRVAKFLEVIATKLNLPPTTQPLGLLMESGGASSQPPTPGNTPLSEDLVRAVLGPEAAVTLDKKEYDGTRLVSDDANGDEGTAPSRKRKRRDDENEKDEPWTVATGQWRLKIQATNSGKSAVECVFVAVKLDCYSDERGRNTAKPFLTG